MADALYVVRRAFPFYAGIPADTGAVFPLGGHVNDEKLVRLGFLEPVTGRPKLTACGVCGTQFLSGQYRDAHGDRRHTETASVAVEYGGHPLDAMPTYSHTGIHGAMVPDIEGDAEDRRLEREAPLNLEKTTASLKG